MSERRVTKDQFFAPIYDLGLDVHPDIISRFPYTSEWRHQKRIGRPLYGRTVQRLEGALIVTDYFKEDTP